MLNVWPSQEHWEWLVRSKRIVSSKVLFYKKKKTRTVHLLNHINYKLKRLLCRPFSWTIWSLCIVYRKKFSYFKTLWLLFKICFLSLQWTSTSCSLRRGRSGPFNNAPKRMDNINLRGLNRLFVSSWLTHRALSVNISVWLADTFWEDFFLDLFSPLHQFSMMQTPTELQESLSTTILTKNNYYSCVKGMLFIGATTAVLI